LAALIGLTSACAMAGFGGALQLNITGQETRALRVEIDAGATESRILEVDPAGDVDLGAGRVTIDRYVLHRARLGSTSATGYFLCLQPCSDPLSNYLVAYSPEQVFTSDGQLELRFRIVAADETSQELIRTIRAEMLPALWENPVLEARAAGR
jgi:hypothetical protein